MRVFRIFWIILSLAVISPVYAQISEVSVATQAVEEVESQIKQIDSDLEGRLDTAERALLRQKALDSQKTLRSAESELQEQLTLFDARIEGLGPKTEGLIETSEIQKERSKLIKQRAEIDGALKRVRLASVEIQQSLDKIEQAEADQLNKELSARHASPLTAAFWNAVWEGIPYDMARATRFLETGLEQIRNQWAKRIIPWQFLIGLALAAALLFPVRLIGRRIGQRYIIGNAPDHQIRRSLFALWKILVGTLTPLWAAFCVVQGLRWADIFPQRWDSFLTSTIGAIGFAAFTASLSGAVLMRQQPSWRIAPISNEAASRLRPLTWLLSFITVFCGMMEAFHNAIGTSRTTYAAWQMTEAIIHILWLSSMLFIIGQLRAARAKSGEDDNQITRSSMAFLTLVIWVLVIGAAIALVLGYIPFSVFIARFVIWAGILAAALYLLWGTADGLATLILNQDSHFGQMLTTSIGIRGSIINQAGVLASACVRLVLMILAFGLLMTPFGGGGGLSSVSAQMLSIAQGIEIGGVTISPGAVVRSIIVLAIGLGLVRAFMSWLEKHYLPATDLDGSARNSASLVARYVGIALVIIWSLASLGIGIERIAILLSALSVGIGFGLQAITQNFVSGLILLAERPIKIGDWVRVGTDEGDVKRISVRSTEITLPDHSTLIVPNSELITKTVLNKTLSDPLGRIQIKFSVPLETNVDRVVEIVHAAFSAESLILEDPSPSVFVDSIADGRIFFNCFAHVASPRAVYRTRSNVFLNLLRTLSSEGIDIGTVPQKFEWSAPEHTLPDESK